MDNEKSLDETIEALMQEEMQAMKHVEMVSMQLLQALQQRVAEVQSIKARVKKAPTWLKRELDSVSSGWGSVYGEIEALQKNLEVTRSWLENMQEKFQSDAEELKRFQEI